MKIHNFCAGPSILPDEVFKQASEAVKDLNGSGLSLLEISHRSHAFVDIMDESCDLALELLDLKRSDYTPLFLQGGASMQFLMTAYNFLKNEAAFLNTGTWSKKAIKEAELFGAVDVLGTSENDNFNHIPKFNISKEYDYFHCTSNNTIFGTQINNFPETSVPIFCDMSSDIFSRKLNFSKFDLIYAGAQKNLGPAGATLVIIKNELLNNIKDDVPSMMNYKIQADKSSMFNTPPVFSVYVSMLNMRWLKKMGGISEIEKNNRKKAEILYSEVDINPLFTGHSIEKDRSIMNATFNLTDDNFKETFESMLAEAKITALSGHRSVGGYRASMYNAMSLDSVKTLVEVMSELESKI